MILQERRLRVGFVAALLFALVACSPTATRTPAPTAVAVAANAGAPTAAATLQPARYAGKHAVCDPDIDTDADSARYAGRHAGRYSARHAGRADEYASSHINGSGSGSQDRLFYRCADDDTDRRHRCVNGVGGNRGAGQPVFHSCHRAHRLPGRAAQGEYGRYHHERNARLCRGRAARHRRGIFHLVHRGLALPMHCGLVL